MIKINLTPPEELENPLWFVPDLLFAALICMVGYFGVKTYLETVRSEKIVFAEQEQALKVEATKLNEYVARSTQLDKDIKNLEDKWSKLKKVSSSKVEKYLPLIVVEHLQNLRPRGVWFEKVAFREGKGRKKGPEEKSVHILGLAVDNLLVAEFMSSLRATQTQDVEASDMRTQVYFSDLTLDSAKRIDAKSKLDGVVEDPDTADEQKATTIQFSLQLVYKTRAAVGTERLGSFRNEYPVNTKFNLARL